MQHCSTRLPSPLLSWCRWLGSAAGFLIITLPMIRLVTILEKRLRSGLTSVVGH